MVVFCLVFFFFFSFFCLFFLVFESNFFLWCFAPDRESCCWYLRCIFTYNDNKVWFWFWTVQRPICPAKTHTHTQTHSHTTHRMTWGKHFDRSFNVYTMTQRTKEGAVNDVRDQHTHTTYTYSMRSHIHTHTYTHAHAHTHTQMLRFWRKMKRVEQIFSFLFLFIPSALCQVEGFERVRLWRSGLKQAQTCEQTLSVDEKKGN